MQTLHYYMTVLSAIKKKKKKKKKCLHTIWKYTICTHLLKALIFNLFSLFSNCLLTLTKAIHSFIYNDVLVIRNGFSFQYINIYLWFFYFVLNYNSSHNAIVLAVVMVLYCFLCLNIFFNIPC